LLKIVLVQYANDYGDTGGSEDKTQKAYANFTTSGTGFVPFIEFDAVESGYGNDVIGVSSGNIGSVIAVASGNIGEIIGV